MIYKMINKDFELQQSIVRSSQAVSRVMMGILCRHAYKNKFGVSASNDVENDRKTGVTASGLQML